MKLILSLMLLFLATNVALAPCQEINKMDRQEKALKIIQQYNQLQVEEDILNYNLVALGDNSKRTRKEVYELIEPVIDIYLRRNNYDKMFPEMDSLSHALTCIFVSESSNGKGQSARSSLWLKHNNPFGLTATQGVTKRSWEEIKGKRVVMNVTFRTFNFFEDCMESLLWDYLFKPRYERVRNSISVEDFLYNLYKCGYMTASSWPTFGYNEIYLKCS